MITKEQKPLPLPPQQKPSPDRDRSGAKHDKGTSSGGPRSPYEKR